jgi:probable HAF family extracellular repeat protein
MKLTKWSLARLALSGVLVTSPWLFAQKEPPAPHYVLTDLGTLPRGYNSYLFYGPPSFRLLNHLGTVAFSAGSDQNDPYQPCFTDCSMNHAARWDNGVLTDLGALPGNKPSSAPLAISENGKFVVGASETGKYDPLTHYPAYNAVLWQSGHDIKNLGTFGGHISTAVAVNDHGQVVGGATNKKSDQYAAGLGPCWSINCWPSATEWHAFSWKAGVMTDLGTLGTGKDAVAGMVNSKGQVAGVSYTNTKANQKTKVPTQDPFFWEEGNAMVDVGTLGGHLGFPTSMNNKGQLVGQSNLAGDTKYHPFLWQKDTGIQDLGTLGGDSGTAMWINEAGDIVGGAQTAGNQAFHAVLWKNGQAQDLGVLASFKHSLAYAINAKGQIIGCLTNNLNKGCTAGFLWENGKMYNLSKLFSHERSDKASMPLNINDSGEIATWWETVGGAFTHVALLTPQ